MTVLLAPGCAPEASAPPSPEPPPCARGGGKPITERMLKDALAAEGIRVYRESDCFTDELVLLSNLTDAVRYEQEDEIRESEGHIFCSLYATGRPSRIRRYVWRNDPEPTNVEVLNVVCSIYPEAKSQTDTLEHALRRLPGVSELPSTVPSDDAVHD